jgi:hypothetical protein
MAAVAVDERRHAACGGAAAHGSLMRLDPVLQQYLAVRSFFVLLRLLACAAHGSILIALMSHFRPAELDKAGLLAGMLCCSSRCSDVPGMLERVG